MEKLNPEFVYSNPAMPITVNNTNTDLSEGHKVKQPCEDDLSRHKEKSPNPEDREDPSPLNRNFMSFGAKVDFDDIFFEPSAIKTGEIGKHMSPRLKVVFGTVFSMTQEAIFYFFSTITGIIFGILWGTVFGLVSFTMVWGFQPAWALMLILLRYAAEPSAAVCRLVLGPLFEAVGHLFSSISVNLRFNLPPSSTRFAFDSRRSLPPAEVDASRSRSQEWFEYA